MCDVDIKWPSSFPGLKTVDQHLRCGICYEYLRTTMVTSCSHNYCSVCIRKSLQYRTQCPSCFEETVETQLRNNRVLDELVRIFTEMRDDLIHCIRLSEYNRSVSQKVATGALSKGIVAAAPATPLGEPVVCSTPCNTPDALRSPVIQPRNRVALSQNPATKNLTGEFNKRARNCLVNRVQQPSTSSAQENAVMCSDDSASTREDLISKRDVLIPSIFSPKKPSRPKAPEKKVACPVCTVEVLEVHVNQHLDACLKTPLKQKKVLKRVPLPKLVYNLMKEKQLRQKLKEAGLSMQGDYKTLVQRHSRYTLLYNAECDALDPRPVSEIIQQVEREERDEKENQASSKISDKLRLLADKRSDPKVVEEARTKYLQENRESFNQLIKSLKQREARKQFPSAVKDDVRSDASSDSGEPATRKQVCVMFRARDSSPDTPDKVETVVVSDDDSSIFYEQTLAHNTGVSSKGSVRSKSPEGSVRSQSSEGSLRSASLVNEAAESCDGDDDHASNKSFSLLENFDPESVWSSKMADSCASRWNMDSDGANEDNKNREVKNSVLEAQQKNVPDSQLEDPSYEPDTQDLLDSEDSNAGFYTKDRCINKSGLSRKMPGVGRLVWSDRGDRDVKGKGRTDVTNVAAATKLKTRFCSKKLASNRRQGGLTVSKNVSNGHSKFIDDDDDDDDDAAAAAAAAAAEVVKNFCPRIKRKVSGCISDESSETSVSNEEYVSSREKGKVKLPNGQQTRNLRPRAKKR